MKEGELSNCLYIIQHGEVKITMGGKFLRRMEPYDYFGESCLFHESVRHASVQAECNVTPPTPSFLTNFSDNCPCHDHRQHQKPSRQPLP